MGGEYVAGGQVVPDVDADEDLPCGCTVCADGAYRLPAPAATSLAAGAIGRGLAEAAAAYRTHLSGLLDVGPRED
jgi:hypothetical protein